MISVRHVQKMIDKAANKIRSTVRRGVLSFVNSEYFAQVETFDGETYDDVELWQQFGLTSLPPADGEACIAKVEGRGEGAIIIATTDRTHRPTGLTSGDTVLYAKTALGGGQAKVHAKADGEIDIVAGTSKTANLGGDKEFLLLGETAKADLATYIGVVKAIVPGTVAQNATALGAIKTAAGVLDAAMGSWLTTKSKAE